MDISKKLREFAQNNLNRAFQSVQQRYAQPQQQRQPQPVQQAMNFAKPVANTIRAVSNPLNSLVNFAQSQPVRDFTFKNVTNPAGMMLSGNNNFAQSPAGQLAQGNFKQAAIATTKLPAYYKNLEQEKTRMWMSKDPIQQRKVVEGDVTAVLNTMGGPTGTVKTKVKQKLEPAVKNLRHLLSSKEVYLIDEFTDAVRSGKGRQDLGQLGRDIHAMTAEAFGKQAAATWSNKRIADAWQYVFKRLSEGKNSIAMGLSVNDVGDAFAKKSSSKLLGQKTADEVLNQESQKVLGKVRPQARPSTATSLDQLNNPATLRLSGESKLPEITPLIDSVPQVKPQAQIQKEVGGYDIASEPRVQGQMRGLTEKGRQMTIDAERSRRPVISEPDMPYILKRAGASPEDIASGKITVYRATENGRILPGDFVTPDKSVLKPYFDQRVETGRNPKIITQKVDVKDLVIGDEVTDFVYRPQSPLKSNTQLGSATNNPKGQNMNLGQQKVDQKVSQSLENSQIPTGQQAPLKSNSSSLARVGSKDMQVAQSLPQQPGGGQSNSSKGIIAQKFERRPQELNVNNLDLNPTQKAELNQMTVTELRTKLGDKEIMNIASRVGINTRSNPIEVTAKRVAEQFNLRRSIVNLTNELDSMRSANAPEADITKKLMEIAKASKTSVEQGTDIARQLRARQILANELDTPMQRIFKLLEQAGIDPEVYTKEAAKVNFDNAGEVVDFYRKLVPAKFGDWVDLVRYNSMLSSPVTHVVNATSNALNGLVVAPIEKTVTGTIDFLKAGITGSKRQAFAGEGPAQLKGSMASLGQAARQFGSVMSGKAGLKSLDVGNIPIAYSGKAGKVVRKLSLPTRLLEATDQFFTAMVEGGETAALNLKKAKGLNVKNIQDQASKNAAYRVFRGELKDPEQGIVLNAVDEVTQKILQLRSSKNPVVSTISKFTLPFVKTPMNIFKQGVEYSPLGYSTIPGAKNKTQQLSKAIMGTAGMLGTMALVTSGRTTWAEPTDATKRAAFRAAGMQPYAIKIGDNWVSYAKLPPAMSIPLAMTAGVHDAYKNKLLTEGDVETWMNAIAKYGNFFANQSYLKNIGDAVGSVSGNKEDFTRFISNYPQQLVPYRAFLGWMARTIDPYQRKVDTDKGFIESQVQQLFKEIPGLSMTVPARLDPSDNPIPNQNPVLNAVSPFRVTTERPDQKANYELMQQKTLNNRNKNALEEELLKGKDITTALAGAEGNALTFTSGAGKDQLVPNYTTAQSDASSGTTAQQKLKAELEDSIIKTKVETSGTPQKNSNGDIIYVNENGNAATIKLTPPTAGTGIGAFVNQNWNITKAREVFNANLPEDVKQDAFKKLGVDPQKVRYDVLANYNNDVKTQYLLSKSPDKQTLIRNILTGREESISGGRFVSDGVVDNLIQQGVLTYAEGGHIKKIGKPAKKSGGRKRARVKVPGFKAIKSTPIKLKKIKFKKVKLGKSKSNKKRIRILE